MKNFNLTEAELLYRYATPMFPGFTGATCENCETTVNLIKGTTDFVCRCNQTMYLPTRSFSKIHPKPDFGPELEAIQAAATQALRGKLQDRIQMLKAEAEAAEAERLKTTSKKKRAK